MSNVIFNGYTFPTNYSNHLDIGAPIPRNKHIRFPGVKASTNLNMLTAERPIAHTGTLRIATQALLNSAVASISSVCDGNRGTFSAPSLGRAFTSVYCDTISFGRQFKADGTGGISTNSSYFGMPFNIKYIQIRP